MLRLLTLHQSLDSYLLIALLLFLCGLYGLLAQRTPLGILIAGQLLCGAACLNTAAFSRFLATPGMSNMDIMGGQGFALLAMLLAGASALTAGLLFLALFRLQGRLQGQPGKEEPEKEELENKDPAPMDSPS